MNVAILRSWSQFDALATEWNALLERSQSRSIFLTWEWIQCWRNAIHDIVEPWVVTVRDADRQLLGVAPLYVDSSTVLGTFDIRTLRMLGDVASGAEYPDWIVAADHEDAACLAIAVALRQHSSEWHALWLTNVAGWTGAERRIRDALTREGLLVRGRDRGFAHVELPDRLRDYEQQFSAKSRQRMRRNTRRILEADDVEVVMCESPAQLQANLTALFELHQQRWQSAGVDGSFQRQPLVEDFYRNMAPVALERGWLRLFVLKQNGIARAIQFGYVFDDCYLQIQEGFDPEFQPGAGNALRHRVIEICLESGIRHYDFLAGVSEHKRRWGAVVRQGYDWLITNRAPRSKLFALTRFWPTGRFMQQNDLAAALRVREREYQVSRGYQ